jgi:MFS family permease
VLVLAPLAGAVVGRVGPVRVMVAAELASVGLAALLPALAFSVPAIYVVAFVMSAAGVFSNPAAGALMPALVDPDELVPANRVAVRA